MYGVDNRGTLSVGLVSGNFSGTMRNVSVTGIRVGPEADLSSLSRIGPMNVIGVSGNFSGNISDAAVIGVDLGRSSPPLSGRASPRGEGVEKMAEKTDTVQHIVPKKACLANSSDSDDSVTSSCDEDDDGSSSEVDIVLDDDVFEGLSGVEESVPASSAKPSSKEFDEKRVRNVMAKLKSIDMLDLFQGKHYYMEISGDGHIPIQFYYVGMNAKVNIDGKNYKSETITPLLVAFIKDTDFQRILNKKTHEFNDHIKTEMQFICRNNGIPLLWIDFSSGNVSSTNGKWLSNF